MKCSRGEKNSATKASKGLEIRYVRGLAGTEYSPFVVLVVAVAMPPPFSKPIQALIQDEFELGHSNDVILAGPYSVSMRSLQRVRHLWRQHGIVFIPNDSLGGRR